ncbi:GMC family oxidoreductase [Aestuariivirga sp.]|uniref:GMC family oxidoreductase n=1 Tax=Aestuariivirga sp. TaxID=2650926 RepID=UPI0039E2A1EF
MEFDYIIVGAGSAGAILANRISEKHSVLLLEAGPSDSAYFLGMPMGYGLSFYNPRYNWMYWSEPVPGLGGRQTYVPRGKVLGGSSSINAMVYMRGRPQDFADWEAAAGPEWNWESVTRAYEAVEEKLKIGSMADKSHPLCQRYFDACLAMGLPLNHNPNHGTQHGVGYNPITVHNGRRMSSSHVFLSPVRRRATLKIETEAMVSRVLFEGTRAVGVAYVRGGDLKSVRARKEVILSAGSINTPHLLQLSGVGPAGLLTRHGIAVVAANAEVGRAMQDHVCYDHYYRARVPTMNEELRPLLGKAKAALEYVLFRKGWLSGSMNQAGGYVRSSPERALPNLQLYFCPASYDRAPPKTRKMTEPDDFPGISISVSNTRPTSLGSVELRSPSPADAPAIQPNLLSTEEDVQEMLEGAHFLRRLSQTPQLAAVLEEEFKPGLQARSDIDLISDIRTRSISVFHPSCTVRMGAALDSRLRVKGVERLRVIDASSFPNIISGNINAPSMMVGWKGADMVLADA